MGGIGKTALALKLVELLKPRYPDAQFFLDLKGASKQPLTVAEVLAHVVRAYHPPPNSLIVKRVAWTLSLRARWPTRAATDGQRRQRRAS